MSQINKTSYLLFLSILLLTFTACTEDGAIKKPPVKSPSTQTKPKPKVNVPSFDGASAYNYVKQQVDFGPRVPGTPIQKECADWLKTTLGEFADETIIQESTVTVYNGKQVPMYNVIGSFNPDNPKRIMLSAHWDTRPFADQDTDRVNEPIDGANDGGSGVGVLLEIARVLKANKIDLGVDIFFWDVEDYGKGGAETYCLGSQYWSRNPHKPNYKAQYGILLDMVGAKNAVFYREGHSMNYAASTVIKVWNAAITAGYSGFFPNQQVSGITDDHYFINTIARIPTIDIIQYDQYAPKGFFEHWHTHGDNMSIIDPNTLKAVGQTLLQVIYEENQ